MKLAVTIQVKDTNDIPVSSSVNTLNTEAIGFATVLVIVHKRTKQVKNEFTFGAKTIKVAISSAVRIFREVTLGWILRYSFQTMILGWGSQLGRLIYETEV